LRETPSYQLKEEKSIRSDSQGKKVSVFLQTKNELQLSPATIEGGPEAREMPLRTGLEYLVIYMELRD
jgi:hypothetical protein